MKTLQLSLMLAAVAAAAGCSNQNSRGTTLPYRLNGPLIPARVTMVSAWDFPKNPLLDATLGASPLGKQIQRGFRIFTNTPGEASRFAPGKVSCSNCHLNGGQREKALPLVGIVGMFPEYNKRAGRLITLADRIVDCFLRSENATGAIAADAVPSPAPRRSSPSRPISRGSVVARRSGVTRRGEVRTSFRRTR